MNLQHYHQSWALSMIPARSWRCRGLEPERSTSAANALRKQNIVVQAYITAFQNVVKCVIAVLPSQQLSNPELILSSFKSQQRVYEIAPLIFLFLPACVTICHQLCCQQPNSTQIYNEYAEQ